jgi:hypothetical protein
VAIEVGGREHVGFVDGGALGFVDGGGVAVVQVLVELGIDDALLLFDAVGEEARKIRRLLPLLGEADLAAGNEIEALVLVRTVSIRTPSPASMRCSLVTSAQPRRQASSSLLAFQLRFL